MEREASVDSPEIRNLGAVILDTGTSMTARERGYVLPCNLRSRFAPMAVMGFRVADIQGIYKAI